MCIRDRSVPDYCETHHEEAYLTNVTAVGQLADLCEEYKSRFIHLSTDFVFDGKINETAGLLYTCLLYTSVCREQ